MCRPDELAPLASRVLTGRTQQESYEADRVDSARPPRGHRADRESPRIRPGARLQPVTDDGLLGTSRRPSTPSEPSRPQVIRETAYKDMAGMLRTVKMAIRVPKAATGPLPVVISVPRRGGRQKATRWRPGRVEPHHGQGWLPYGDDRTSAARPREPLRALRRAAAHHGQRDVRSLQSTCTGIAPTISAQ